MRSTDPKAYGSSWYAATKVASPPRGAAHRRARRRRLRDRRGARRSHRRARGRAARLVGRGAGGATRRLERVGPQHRLRAAGICRERRRADRRGSASIAPRRCGRCRRRAPNMSATRSAKPACRASTCPKAAGCMCRRPTTTARWRIAAPICWPAKFGAAVEFWPAERVREALALAALFQRDPLSARLQHPSAQLRARPCGRRRSRRRAHLRGYAGARDRSGRRAQARRHDGMRACARPMWCWPATSTSTSLMPQFAEHAVADLQLRHRHRAARRRAARGDRLSRRGERHRSRRQSLPRRRRRPPDVVGPQHGLARPAAALCRDARSRHRAHLSAAPRRQGRVRLDRDARQHRASHAADRRDLAGALAAERLRRAWAQHHGDGRRDHRARHRRRRPDLADVLAVRVGLGRRRVRPRGAAGYVLVVPRARAHRSRARAARARPGAGARRAGRRAASIRRPRMRRCQSPAARCAPVGAAASQSAGRAAQREAQATGGIVALLPCSAFVGREAPSADSAAPRVGDRALRPRRW